GQGGARGIRAQAARGRGQGPADDREVSGARGGPQAEEVRALGRGAVQKQLDLAQMRNEIETKMKELENQLQLDQKRLEGPLTKKLVDVMESAGKEAGFPLIMRRGSPGLLYTREALDITDLIIKKYNQKG